VLAHGGGVGEVPPPLTAGRLFTSWVFEPSLLVPLAQVGAAYLWGVRVLRRRGDEWGRWRIVSWFAGLAVIFIGTSSVLHTYDTTLFSVHKVQHMCCRWPHRCRWCWPPR
jgi:cytochrome c oxidase assembly factor CtaG